MLFLFAAPPDDDDPPFFAEELVLDRFPLPADLEPLAVDLELPVDLDPPLDLPDEPDRDDVPELFPADARPALDPEADFAAVDLAELDLPLPEELERPPVLLPLEEDLDLDEPDDRPPEADFPFALLADPDVDLRELPPERPEPLARPLPDDDDAERPRDDVIVSAAAPTAPTAAPAAAPLRMSPATSMTLSTIPDDSDLFERDDLPRDAFDEDDLLFFELLELVLVAITFLPNDRDKS